MSWQEQALCAQIDLELWFPPKGAGCFTAKRICRGCPVRAQCLEAGLHEDYGIWGGLTVPQRKQLRRQENAA